MIMRVYFRCRTLERRTDIRHVPQVNVRSCGVCHTFYLSYLSYALRCRFNVSLVRLPVTTVSDLIYVSSSAFDLFLFGFSFCERPLLRAATELTSIQWFHF